MHARRDTSQAVHVCVDGYRMLLNTCTTLGLRYLVFLFAFYVLYHLTFGLLAAAQSLCEGHRLGI